MLQLVIHILKRRWMIGIITMLVLFSLSFVSAIGPEKKIDNKESPLFGYRTSRVIEKLREDILLKIKTKFLRQRVLLPILTSNADFELRQMFNKYSTVEAVEQCYTVPCDCTVHRPFCDPSE